MKVLLHAPTSNSLVRARANAISLLQTDEEAAVVIVANGGAVAAALDNPDPTTDNLLVVCSATLRHENLPAPAAIETTPEGSYLIAKMQRKGWSYLRA